MTSSARGLGPGKLEPDGPRTGADDLEGASAAAPRQPARTETPPHQRSRAGALLAATRPKQWIKNVLVYAAPAAAGTLFHARPLLRTTAAGAAFVAVSAAMYLVNDVMDREADRLHPVKRSRPIASGAVSPRAALALATVLTIAGVAAAGLLSWRLLVVLAFYAGITLAYSIWLKHVPVIELACVASGFILRAVAGGAATRIPLSPWFLLVTSFGALFVVTGKRSSEHVVMGDERAVHRSTLGDYPTMYLRAVRAIAATVTVSSYCLWAFDRTVGPAAPRLRVQHLLWFELSIVPFVLAILVVELAFEQGRGGEPEELALKNLPLQILGLCWMALLVIGIYT